MTQKILILGATSAIAEHAARLWAVRGASLYLVGRSAERLESVAEDLRVRGAPAVHTHVADLCALQLHAAIAATAESALGGLDVVLVAHGLLSPHAENLSDGVREMMDTNATSAISLSEHVASALERRGAGVLVVIGSPAGDRGRATNALYGAAKAALAAHASATRQRLARSGAWVVLVKPGFVDTPMTSGFAKGPLWSSPQAVARGLVRAVDRRRAVVYLPGYWTWIMRVIRSLPEAVFLRTRF